MSDTDAAPPDQPHHESPLSSETPQDAADEKEEWPHWAEAYLDALRKVPNYSRAAREVGIDRRTPERLRLRDERFAVAVHDAREESLDRLEETIFARATAGTPVTKTVTKRTPDGKGGETVETTVTEERHVSDVLAMFYLKRWRPEFRESYRIETTGPRGGPIQHEVTHTEQVVANFRQELERLGPSPLPLPEPPPE